MKIALFSDVYVPAISGVSTSTQLLRNELINKGHEVFVYTVKDPDAKSDAKNIIRLPSLPFISEKRISLSLSPKTRAKMKAENFDIIHTQTEFGIGLLGRSLARNEKIPFVHTFHTIYDDFTQDMLANWPRFINKSTARIMRSISRNFCNSADEVIVPTKKTADLLSDYGVVAPLNIIPTGLDLNRFYNAASDNDIKRETRNKLGLKQDDFVLLYLGRVSNEKHIDELFDYLFKLFPKTPSLKMVITGEGAALSRLQKRVKNEKQQDHVLFTGPVSVEDVPHYYAMADVFTSASQSETQGLTYIEALASGLPILVREDPSLHGVINDGVNGNCFVDEESFRQGLKLLMAQLHNDKDIICRNAMSSAAKCDVSHFADQVLNVYQLATTRIDLRKETEEE